MFLQYNMVGAFLVKLLVLTSGLLFVCWFLTSLDFFFHSRIDA